jgi:hypothetical protein
VTKSADIDAGADGGPDVLACGDGLDVEQPAEAPTRTIAMPRAKRRLTDALVGTTGGRSVSIMQVGRILPHSLVTWRITPRSEPRKHA